MSPFLAQMAQAQILPPQLIVSFDAGPIAVPLGATPLLIALGLALLGLVLACKGRLRGAGIFPGIAALLLAAGLFSLDAVRAQIAMQTLDLENSPSALPMRASQNNSVLVRNKTNRPVVIRSIIIAHDSANAYRVAKTPATTCALGAPLQSGATCAVEVRYTYGGSDNGGGEDGGGDNGGSGSIEDPKSPDNFADRAQAIAEGDPRVTPSTTEELTETFKSEKTPEAANHSQRLRNNHSLVLTAVDPDPSWHRTEASTGFIVAEPGSSYAVDLRKIDSTGKDLGPLRKADQLRLRFEVRVQHSENRIDYVLPYTQKNYIRWDSANPGRLLVTVPVDIQQGRVLIGIRPSFRNKGQAAIAERWSVPVVAEVWQRRAGVQTIALGSIFYPARFANGVQPSPGSAFSMTDIEEHLRQAYADLPDTILLKPLVVAGAGLTQGQLVDSRIPRANGDNYPYGGRVARVIEGSGGQQLVLLDFDLASTYHLLEDDPLVREGVMPEFVTYRKGPPQQAPDRQSEPELEFFGPEERSGIKTQHEARPAKNVLEHAKIDISPSCSASGSMSLAFTPILEISPKINVGVEYTIAANGSKVECAVKLEGPDLLQTLSVGLPLVRLAALVGMKLEAHPYGEVKLGLTPKSSSGVSAFFSQTGRVTYLQGMAQPQLEMSSGDVGSGKGLDDTPGGLEASLGGGLGLGAALTLDPFKLFGGSFQVVNLEAKSELNMGTAIDSRNAAAIKQWGTASSASFTLKPEANVQVSTGFVNFMKFLGLKAEAGVGASLKLIDHKVDANYLLGDVQDSGDGSGSVTFKELSMPTVLRSLFSGTTAGYASLAHSSVYNDPTGGISYELDECTSRGGTISTPLVACKSGLFCGRAEKNADFCKAAWVSPLLATAYVGNTAHTQGSVGTNSTNLTTVGLTGTPLQPSPTSLTLAGAGTQSFTARSACTARGVTRGNIQVTLGSSVADAQSNTLVCNCKPGDTDCDRTWASPHLMTADGLAYDYVASGDYILARVHDAAEEPVHGFEVQSRFLPGYDVSWPQAAAMQVGNDVLEVRAVPFSPPEFSSFGYVNALELYVNGQLLANLNSSNFWKEMRQNRIHPLPSGGLVYFDDFTGRGAGRYWAPRSITVLWPQQGAFKEYAVKLSTPYLEQGVLKGNSFPLMEIQIIRPDVMQGGARGMLGNNDGNPHNDMIRRNGEILAQSSNISWTALYALFGGDWLAKPQECLFSDGCLNQLIFPEHAVVLTDVQRTQGEIACLDLKGYYREACIHDVGLSGSTGLVRDYYANTEDLNTMADKLVTPRVDVPEYSLELIGDKSNLPEYSGKGFAQAYRVAHVNGKGQFMLIIRPPRNGSAFFSNHSAGSHKQSFASTGSQEISVDVQCNRPDPAWAQAEGIWPFYGAVQLWAIDPLSGFASHLLSENLIDCNWDADNIGKLAATTSQTSFFLDKEGQLWAWGRNYTGELGNGTNTPSYHPVRTDLSPLGNSQAISISASGNHVLLMDNKQRLWAWGSNQFGQLGDGTYTDRNRPVLVDLTSLGSSKIMEVSAGGGHTIALDDQGRLWAWGNNLEGALGDGTRTNQTTPVLVDIAPLNGSKVVHAAAGTSHSVAVDDEGRLWAWGIEYGQRSHNSLTIQDRPVQVDMGLMGGRKVVTLSAGYHYTLALDDRSQMWAWGANLWGQLGYGGRNTQTRPLLASSHIDGSQIIAIAAGKDHSLHVDNRGRLSSWGLNTGAQLGNGNMGWGHGSMSPRQIVDPLVPKDIKIVAASASDHHNLALDNKGHLWEWGYIWSRNGEKTYQTSPKLVQMPPSTH